MKLFTVFLTLIALTAQAKDHITPCVTGFIKDPKGYKSFEVHLISTPSKGYYSMRIYKNQGSKRTELPPIEITYKPEGREISTLVSTETGQTVLAYRNRVAPTRTGTVLIQDGKKELELSITCHFI